MDGWIDGWMDGLLSNACGWINRQWMYIDKLVKNPLIWMDGWMDGWKC